jgi:hypothetical protein
LWYRLMSSHPLLVEKIDDSHPLLVISANVRPDLQHPGLATVKRFDTTKRKNLTCPNIDNGMVWYGMVDSGSLVWY